MAVKTLGFDIHFNNPYLLFYRKIKGLFEIEIP